MAPSRWPSTRMLTPASGSFFSFVTRPASLPVVPARARGAWQQAASVRITTPAARIALRDIVLLLSGAPCSDHGRGRQARGTQQARRGVVADAVIEPSSLPSAAGDRSRRLPLATIWERDPACGS